MCEELESEVKKRANRPVLSDQNYYGLGTLDISTKNPKSEALTTIRSPILFYTFPQLRNF